ncbi:hypothetical protein VTG60DRAFT_139 [Thermothelomyces hinnuleus]
MDGVFHPSLGEGDSCLSSFFFLVFLCFFPNHFILFSPFPHVEHAFFAVASGMHCGIYTFSCMASFFSPSIFHSFIVLHLHFYLTFHSFAVYTLQAGCGVRANSGWIKRIQKKKRTTSQLLGWCFSLLVYWSCTVRLGRWKRSKMSERTRSGYRCFTFYFSFLVFLSATLQGLSESVIYIS